MRWVVAQPNDVYIRLSRCNPRNHFQAGHAYLFHRVLREVVVGFCGGISHPLPCSDSPVIHLPAVVSCLIIAGGGVGGGGRS